MSQPVDPEAIGTGVIRSLMTSGEPALRRMLHGIRTAVRPADPGRRDVWVDAGRAIASRAGLPEEPQPCLAGDPACSGARVGAAP